MKKSARQREWERRRRFLIFMAVCAAIVVVGGGFLLVRGLITGGAATPPETTQAPPSQPIAASPSPEGASTQAPESTREPLPEETPPRETLSAEVLAALEQDMDYAVRQHAAVGAQAAVIKNGQIVANLAVGWATKDSDKMTVDHKMRVASLAKIAVGMGAMALAEDDVVRLDEPIGTYWGTDFKNPTYPEVPVTIRNLLSHTSSLTAAGDSVSCGYDEVKARLSSSKGYTANKPGDMAGWSYNNYAYSVLGMTLELAANKTMDDLMDEQFFLPLGIDAAFEMGEIKATDKLMTLYREDKTPWRTTEEQRTIRLSDPTPGANGKYFAGGFTIGAADLAKLIAVLANDGVYEGQRLLRAESVATMEEKSAQPAPENTYYQALPMDYQEDLYGREGVFFHNGNAYGAFTCASYDPLTGDGAVVLVTGSYPGKTNGIYTICNAINEKIYAALGT